MYPQHIAVFRHLLQEIAVLPQIDRGGSHHFLADRINGRVRHLREKLLEVVEQRVVCSRKHRDRRVHAHRRNRLRAVFRHRQNACFQIFIRVAERLLHPLPLLVGKLWHALVGDFQLL